jgi:tRNA modification GTPase
VERRGIEMGEKRAERADVEIELIPAEIGRTGDRQQAAGRRIQIVSKGDQLVGEAEGLLVTSARTGQGIEELKAAVIAMVGVGGEEGVVVTSERQRDLLVRASEALGRAAEAVRAGQAEEVLALEVREGARALAEVLGEEVGEEVLDALFARFCIGK